MNADARLDPVMVCAETVGQLQLELSPSHGVVALDHAFLRRIGPGSVPGRYLYRSPRGTQTESLACHVVRLLQHSTRPICERLRSGSGSGGDQAALQGTEHASMVPVLQQLELNIRRSCSNVVRSSNSPLWNRSNRTTRVLLNRTAHVLTTTTARHLDSPEHFCGLSLPVQPEGWFMSSSIHGASSPACIVSTSLTSQQQSPIDFLTRSCGLYPSTLFREDRHHGRRWPTASDQLSHRAPDLRSASRACSPHRQPVSGTGSEGQDCPRRRHRRHRVRTCRCAGNRDTDEVGKMSDGPVNPCELDTDCHRVRTCPTPSRRGSTTGAGWRSPSRRAAHPYPSFSGDKA